MLTIKDCIALCELTEDEVEAIAEHEGIPDIVAAELGNYLVRRPDGVPAIKRIILDDIDEAKRRGDLRHAVALRLVLRHFVDTHKDAAAGRARPARGAS